MFRTTVALVALAFANSAVAQSTSTTIDMGGGMSHVDTVGPNGAMSSSNCMDMGGGMATCNTMDMSLPQRTNPKADMSYPQTSGTALNFIGDLVARSRERSFQKKVGKMLEAGDCQGAAKVAIAHQRPEMSNQIRRSCIANPSSDTTNTATVEQPIAGLTPPSADRVQSQDKPKTPIAFDLLCEGTEITSSNTSINEQKYRRYYRINLEIGRYCDDDCSTTKVIAKVDEYRIKLYDFDGVNGASIDRENGELSEVSATPYNIRTAGAKCERRPFSGFPERQF